MGGMQLPTKLRHLKYYVQIKYFWAVIGNLDFVCLLCAIWVSKLIHEQSNRIPEYFVAIES